MHQRRKAAGVTWGIKFVCIAPYGIPRVKNKVYSNLALVQPAPSLVGVRRVSVGYRLT